MKKLSLLFFVIGVSAVLSVLIIAGLKFSGIMPSGLGSPYSHVDHDQLFGEVTLERVVLDLDLSRELAEQMESIVEEEFEYHRQWVASQKLNEREKSRLKFACERNQERAWYDNDPDRVHALNDQYLAQVYGEKARPPMIVAWDRIAELLTEDQREKLYQTLDDFCEITFGGKRDKELLKAMNAQLPGGTYTTILEEEMRPSVSAQHFSHTLPFDILLSESMLPLQLTASQRGELDDIENSYRQAGHDVLTEYYSSVADQLELLRTLNYDFENLGEDRQEEKQRLKKEIDAILNPESLMPPFHKAIDQIEDVLDDNQEEAFNPIKEEALARFADYVHRSMTCDNMQIMRTICGEWKKEDCQKPVSQEDEKEEKVN